MEPQDDELIQSEAHGAAPLPPSVEGHAGRAGARIWYASCGTGPAAILLRRRVVLLKGIRG